MKEMDLCWSANEVCHPSEVCHLYFTTILKLLCYDISAYNYPLMAKGAIPFI